jgi:hypothetical protein
MNIPEHRIWWVPKFLSKNEKTLTYIICPKYIGQNKDSQTNEYFSSILRTAFQEFSRMPNFEPLKNSNCKHECYFFENPKSKRL